MPNIKNVVAEEMLDSRGNPTVKVTVITDGVSASFSVPSGASTGAFEAHEIKNIKQVITNVEEKIFPALKGLDITDQAAIDRIMLELDATSNKSNLGGNALTGVSIACAKAAAAATNQEIYQYLEGLAEIKPSRPTPLLFMNLVNGGKHARSKLPFQEYHVVPMMDSIDEALEAGTKIFKTLRDDITKEMAPQFANVGDEGGATIDTGETVDTADARKPLELLTKAIEENGYSAKVRLAMDVAASSFFENGAYKIGEESLDATQLNNLYAELIKEFNIFSIEDPFEEESFGDFAKLLKEHEAFYVVGDDLTVTNVQRLQKAINNKSINAIIIKPNQIGTLTETLETIRQARNNNIECIISHRSGETEDDFIADLAYAFRCFGLKAGAPNRGERVVKYNRLKHIVKK